MSHKKRVMKSKIGKPPGTLIYTGDKKIESSVIKLIEYNETDFSTKQIKSLDELRKIASVSTDNHVRWININGLHNVELLSEIGNIFNVHSLIMEDVVNIYSRTKVDYYDHTLYAVVKKAFFNSDGIIKLDHLSIFLNEKFVFSFQDEEEDAYKEIYERIQIGRGILRNSKGDYLFYVLLDYIID